MCVHWKMREHTSININDENHSRRVEFGIIFEQIHSTTQASPCDEHQGKIKKIIAELEKSRWNNSWRKLAFVLHFISHLLYFCPQREMEGKYDDDAARLSVSIESLCTREKEKFFFVGHDYPQDARLWGEISRCQRDFVFLFNSLTILSIRIFSTCFSHPFSIFHPHSKILMKHNYSEFHWAFNIVCQFDGFNPTEMWESNWIWLHNISLLLSKLNRD